MTYRDHRIADYLERRAVLPHVATARGYRLVYSGRGDGSGAFARDYGFREYVGGLLVPFHSIGDAPGEPASAWQVRYLGEPPEGRPKFESPDGQPNVLDHNPLMRDSILDRELDLWLVEGVTRADALAGLDIPALAVAGVWNWRSRDGISPLHSLNWRGRRVVWCPDGDVLTSDGVMAATRQLLDVLVQTKRVASVLVVKVPDGLGLDDYIAAGRDVLDLDRVVLRDLERTRNRGASGRVHTRNAPNSASHARVEGLLQPTSNDAPRRAPTRSIHDLCESATADGAAARLLASRGADCLVALSDTDHARLYMADPTGCYALPLDDVHEALAAATDNWVRSANPLEVPGGVMRERWNHLRALSQAPARSRALESVGAVHAAMRDEGTLPDGLEACRPLDLNLGAALGAPNGVVDIETGRLLSPADGRRRRITLRLPDAFDPDVQHPLVDTMFAHVPADILTFALQALAWALRGDPARRLYLVRGSPGGGKTTFKEALLEAFGQYGVTLSDDALASTRESTNDANTAPLVPVTGGPRLAFLDEPRRSEAVPYLVKRISGGGTLRVRNLYQQATERRITATVFAFCNTGQEPQIPTSERAMFDRLQIIDYPALPPEGIDSRYRSLFQTDGTARQALVAMVVHAGVGLTGPPDPPPRVQDARRDWQAESDGEIGVWLREHVRPALNAALPTATLREAVRRDIPGTSDKAIANKTAEVFGVSAKKSQSGTRARYWPGLVLDDGDGQTSTLELPPARAPFPPLLECESWTYDNDGTPVCMVHRKRARR